MNLLIGASRASHANPVLVQVTHNEHGPKERQCEEAPGFQPSSLESNECVGAGGGCCGTASAWLAYKRILTSLLGRKTPNAFAASESGGAIHSHPRH